MFYMISKSLAETQKIAQEFLQKLIPHKDAATVVGLFGDLGSGKTAFTQAVARELGVKEFVTSPTFVIMKIYPLRSTISNLQSTNLIHIDAYRLESGGELSTLGFSEILKDPKNIIFIEWPERVENILPKNLIKINFKFISEFEREIDMV